MDPELTQRILQKQASQIGNLDYTVTLQEAQLEIQAEQLEALQKENEELKAKLAAEESVPPADEPAEVSTKAKAK